MSNFSKEPSWSWSYGSWIHNYLCDQCLSPLTLRFLIDWNYPRGSLDIHFNQQVPFQLCVKDWIGGDAFTIFDNTLGKVILLDTLSGGKYSLFFSSFFLKTIYDFPLYSVCHTTVISTTNIISYWKDNISYTVC
jgi:hypothetical protein